jgi:hypothetical protein
MHSWATWLPSAVTVMQAPVGNQEPQVETQAWAAVPDGKEIGSVMHLFPRIGMLTHTWLLLTVTDAQKLALGRTLPRRVDDGRTPTDCMGRRMISSFRGCWFYEVKADQ